MKRICTILAAAFCAVATFADDPEWLHFATGAGGEVVQSVKFAPSEGRLTFGDETMHYADNSVSVDIPYTGGAYIYFGDAPELPQTPGDDSGTGIADVANSALQLVYSSAAELITLEGCDEASSIALFDAKGSLLRVARGTDAVSTRGIRGGTIVVVAKAVCGVQTIANEFIIK